MVGAAAHMAGITELADQTGHLGAEEAADLEQVVLDRPFVGLA